MFGGFLGALKKIGNLSGRAGRRILGSPKDQYYQPSTPRTFGRTDPNEIRQYLNQRQTELGMGGADPMEIRNYLNQRQRELGMGQDSLPADLRGLLASRLGRQPQS